MYFPPTTPVQLKTSPHIPYFATYSLHCPSIYTAQHKVHRMCDIRIHVRHCLLYEFQQGRTAADATRNICTYVAPDALSHSTAKYWFHRFRQGNFNVGDRPRSGRPSKIDTKRLQALIQADSTRTTRSLANELKTSHSTVERHLHEFGMQFYFDHWVYVGVPGTSTSTSSAPQYEQQPTTSNVNTPVTSTTYSSSSSWTQSSAAAAYQSQPPIQQQPLYN